MRYPIVINLTEEEYTFLQALAFHGYRRPSDQARAMLLNGLGANATDDHTPIVIQSDLARDEIDVLLTKALALMQGHKPLDRTEAARVCQIFITDLQKLRAA